MNYKSAGKIWLIGVLLLLGLTAARISEAGEVKGPGKHEVNPEKSDQPARPETKRGDDVPIAPPKNAGGNAAEDPERVEIVIEAFNPVIGPAEAPVTIVEFTEFQCPFCARAANTIEEVRAHYGNKVRIVIKQNPLSFHKNAMLAAIAAAEANRQRKFEEYAKILFENKSKLERENLIEYAIEVRLNMTDFRSALDGEIHKPDIEIDMAYAIELGARGVPTFFVNGIRLVGAQPFIKFRELIDRELNSNRR